MGTPTLQSLLKRHARLAVDSMVFIYHIEEQAPYLPLTNELFKRIERGEHEAVTSALSLTEVLIHPFRKNAPELAVLYRGLLTEFPHLRMISLDPAIAELAASIRAHYHLATPDAIQVATALRQGATALVSNDAKLSKLSELQVLLLDDYV